MPGKKQTDQDLPAKRGKANGLVAKKVRRQGDPDTSTPRTANSRVVVQDSESSTTRAIHGPVRVPSFWADKPKLWFANVEAQFAIAGINEEAVRYAHVLANLDSKTADIVEDIISETPEINQYQELKTALITRLSASQETRFKILLEREEMGDRTPSQFLRYMRGLGGVNFSEDLLRSLWMSRLPIHFRDILAVSSATNLVELACLADKMAENHSTPQISSSDSSTDVTALTAQIASLTSTVAALVADRERVRPVERTRVEDRSFINRTRINRINQSQYRSSVTQDEICWYHLNFGAMARRCIKPCAFRPKNVEGGQ